MPPMKKIIISLIILSVISSCWNKEKIETATWTTNTWSIQWIDKNTDSELNATNSGQTNDNDWYTNLDTNVNTDISTWIKPWKTDDKVVNKPWVKKEIPVKANTDDEALETEVNDLLDEFINSLDSYDK